MSSAGVGLVVIVGVVLAWRVSEPLTDWGVVALSPWVFAAAILGLGTRAGSWLVIQPPLVYLLALTVATTCWAVLDRLSAPRPETGVAVVGSVAVLPALGGGGTPGFESQLLVGLGSLGLTAGLAGVVWWRFGHYFPDRRDRAGLAGLFVVFGHLLDGVTTAVGIDRLGLGEQTPLARMVLSSVEGAPVAPIVGVGWVFILLKVVVALLFVWWVPGFSRSAHDRRFLYALVATLGLGPGVQNLLLLL